jgi:hypothetical protein
LFVGKIWSEIAEEYEWSDDVVFGVFDAMNNEIDTKYIDVTTAPQAYLFLAEDKLHPLRYDGKMVKDDIIDFLEEHTGKNKNNQKQAVNDDTPDYDEL